MKGEIAQVEEKNPKKSVAKSMMEALRDTAESLSMISQRSKVAGVE